MNSFIEHIDKLSFSVWEGLHISIIQLLCLLVITCFLSLWLFSKYTKNLIVAMCFAALFFILRNADLIHHQLQQKIIIYNVPKLSAADIIIGNTCSFTGDPVILENAPLKNFNLKPSRIKNRVFGSKDTFIKETENCVLTINSKKILFIGSNYFIGDPTVKIKLDALILSRNSKSSPAEINKYFNCDYIIADSSIPQWLSAKWKEESEQLHLRFYSVAHQGAFTLKL